MSLLQELQKRSDHSCELCTSKKDVTVYEVQPIYISATESSAYICSTCIQQIDKKTPLDISHWQCLTTSMWSEIPAIQVISWRLLQRLKTESWASESIDMLFLEEEILAWAKQSGDHENNDVDTFHRDCNGQLLQSGDTVVLIKSLDVKGSTLNAKLGTVVRNIRLVDGNTSQIEGKIEGQTIVILTQYVRRQA